MSKRKKPGAVGEHNSDLNEVRIMRLFSLKNIFAVAVF